MSKIDLRNRAPEVQKLPDGRLRVVRRSDLLNFVGKTPAQLLSDVWLAWGATDADFTACRLIKQDVGGQGFEFPDDSARPATLTRIYEELPATSEQVVGNPEVVVTQYNLKKVVVTSLQFSAGTAIYGTPGVSTAPSPYSSYILESQEDTDDGTLRTIKRTYAELGQLAQYEELKFGGKLKLRTIKTLGTVPSTPSGFTAVTQSIEFIGGLKVYSYGYASGSVAAGNGGEVSRDIQYNISPDQGTTGVTVTTITFLSDPSITTNPITGPVGSQLISVKVDDSDGFRTWRAVYASGTGLISSDVDTREGGKLVIYTRTAINTAPSAPSATIGGTVTLISDKTRNGTDAAAGVIIYDRVWAEGVGEVGRDRDLKYTGMLERITIRHLTATSVTTQPTSDPLSGGVLLTEDRQDQDGYRLWTVVWTKALGTSLIRDDTITKNTGKLIIYRRSRFNSAPAAPSATISGTVTEISTETRLEDGFTVYDKTWAEGLGTLSTIEEHEEGDLEITTTVQLIATTGGLPSEPSNLIRRQVSVEDGYRTVTDRYISTGSGQSSYTEQTRGDGSTEYNVTDFGASAAVPADPTSGSAYLVAKRQQPQPGGYWTNQATYIKPPGTFTFKKQMNFPMPGLAAFSGNQLVVDPPVNRTVLADVEVSFSTSQITDTPYSVIRNAPYYAAWTPTNPGNVSLSAQQGLGDYVGDSSVTGTNDTFNGVLCDTYVAVVGPSSPTSRPSGSTILQVDNDLYLLSLGGTAVYRRTKATYSF